MKLSTLLAKLLALVVVGSNSLFSVAALAQTQYDPLNTSPRGLTDEVRATAAPASGASNPRFEPEVARDQLQQPAVFGSQIFKGRFSGQSFSGFNPDYQLTVGDQINLRMWGAFNYESVQSVDAQGNIFLPSVGPISVLGVKNADLNRQIETQVKKVFKSNVGVYSNLAAAQPVKVYVTGFVVLPGLYGGLSSDSILTYLDRAGGVDARRGSYLDIKVLRSGRIRAAFNLYEFILTGQLAQIQLQDGDTIIVNPRKHTVQITGEVLNAYLFEFNNSSVTADELFLIARVKPGATHFSVVKKIGVERRSEYHSLVEAANVTIQDGDEVVVTSDKYPGTILVRIEGAHLGERTLVLPYGAHLSDALGRLKPAAQAQVEAIQLFRRSVAARQKELIETSLRSLETYALTARSATSEEASLRTREGQQILQFIERARQVEPRGQVILAQVANAGDTLLEDGDVIRVPETSNLVLVSGEVLFPNALAFDSSAQVKDYINRSGGYTQGADKSKIVVLHQDGSVSPQAFDAPLRPGDEIMVLPRIQTKNIEVTRGITQIIYQIAVAAKVLFDL